MLEHPFKRAVETILKREDRYDSAAYFFLKDALDFTLQRAAESNGGELRHVSGKELCIGYRDLALATFGPGAVEQMHQWGVRESSDIGEMVFHLIDEEILGKQPGDQKEDFANAFDSDQPFGPPTP